MLFKTATKVKMTKIDQEVGNPTAVLICTLNVTGFVLFFSLCKIYVSMCCVYNTAPNSLVLICLYCLFLQRFLAEARNKLVQPRLSEMTARGMEQTNWKFVEALLKECKTKVRF